MVSRSFLSVLCAVAIVPQTIFASLDLTFDMTQLGNPDLDASNVWVTFAGNQAEMTYGSQAISFANNLSNGFSTSLSYSLSDIAANGLTITSANSMTAYISYGSSAGFSQLASGTSPNFQSTSLTRFSQFEFSYANNSGGIDMTNISQFGGALRVQTLAGTQVQAYIANGNGTTTTTAQMFQAMAAASGNSPSAVYTNNGQYTRIIGSNVFTAANPYPTFNNYLSQIYDGGTTGTGGAKVALTDQIANLAPGAENGGQGSIGITGTPTGPNPNHIVAGAAYNINYQMSAELVQVSGPSAEFPNGTYSVKITGTVYATPATGGASIVYSNVSVTIAADSASSSNMTNFLYLQTLNAPIQYSTAGLDQLIADFGEANVSASITQKFTGDFGQAIAAGFADSTVMVNVNGVPTALGTLTTYEWFNLYNQTAYSLAQPGNENNYNQFANVVYLNSPGDGTQSGEGQIGTGAFNYGSVYGTPYDDRFGLNLLSPDADTTGINVILQADGDLNAVPEPGTVALLLGGGLALYVIRRRQRRLAA